MYARVTLLEIDTLRTTVEAALERFRNETLPRLRRQPGYQGVWVLTTSTGNALLMSLWDTAEHADAEGDHHFYADELGRYATLFRSPPGRDEYEVVLVDQPTHHTS
jgi:heme-degrading monooxygenase HmoA